MVAAGAAAAFSAFDYAPGNITGPEAFINVGTNLAIIAGAELSRQGLNRLFAEVLKTGNSVAVVISGAVVSAANIAVIIRKGKSEAKRQEEACQKTIRLADLHGRSETHMAVEIDRRDQERPRVEADRDLAAGRRLSARWAAGCRLFFSEPSSAGGIKSGRYFCERYF
ncbi:MAG: hypothetical protein LBO05_10395 [Deltaproteobacteria bacterium]|nr:hypothetical protein [Deltaproteobacteria bacterium]